MKYLLLLFFFVSFLSFAEFPLRAYEKTPKTESAIRSLTSLLGKQKMEELIRDFISNSRPSRLVGTEGNIKAREWILANVKKADPKGTGKIITNDFSLDVSKAKKFYDDEFKNEVVNKFSPTDPFYVRWNNFTKDVTAFIERSKELKGQNILWQKKGYINPDDILIISANFDTLAIDPNTLNLNLKASMPGADNNASGVSILLALVDLLSSVDLPKTVWIVFTDFDEFAFSGTNAFLDKHAADLKKMRSVAHASVVMVGHDTKSQDREKKYGNMCVYIRKPSEDVSSGDRKLATKLLSRNWDDFVKFSVVANSFNWTGDSLFWEKGFPALVFTQNWDSDLNPSEHSPNDIVETLNMNTLYGVYRFVSGAVLGWVFDI